MKTIKLGNFFMNITYVIYLTLFYIVFVGTIGVYAVLEPYTLLSGVGIFCFGIAGMIFIKNSSIKCSDKKFTFYFCLMMCLMGSIQLYFISRLQMQPGSDRAVVFHQALDMVQKGVLKSGERWNHYFLRYPNNRFFLLVETGFLYWINRFGFVDYFVYGLSFLNLFCIDSAVMLTVLLCKRLWNKRYAAMLALFCFLFPPFYLYTPFFYTDTLVLPIVATILFLYYLLLQQKTLLSVKSFGICFVLGLLFAVGFLLKATVLILFIALIIHIFYQKTTRKAWLSCIVVLMVITTIITVGIRFTNQRITNEKIFDETDYETQNFPLTHWVMMGLNGIGKYELPDRRYTSSFRTKEEKSAADIKAIKERLKQYGISGVIAHIIVKSVYTWHNGEYDMNYYLEYKQPLEKTPLQTYVYDTGQNHLTFEAYCDGIHLCVLFALLYAGICCFRKKDKEFGLFLKLGILGLFLFLLLWETRPRYLMQYMPLILLTALQGWNFFSEKVEKSKLAIWRKKL